MPPRPIGASPARRTPKSISRRGPKRSTTTPAKNPKSGPITSFAKALPEVTWARLQPSSLTKKS